MAVAARKLSKSKKEVVGRMRKWSGRFPLVGSSFYALAVTLSLQSLASAQADAPPHNYLDLGPHFVLAPGLGSVTEYRDTLFRKSTSARIAATATYRGWSLSGALDQSTSSHGTRASELLATYSHKVPYADLHIGIVHAQVDGVFSSRCTAANLTASSNSLSSTKLDLTVQSNFSGMCRSVSIGASQVLWNAGSHQIDLRASASDWKTDALKTEGWSLRLIGRWQREANQSLHYHVGYIDSKLNQGTLQGRPRGATVGMNYVWEFR